VVGLSGFTAGAIAADAATSPTPAPAPAVSGSWGPDLVAYSNGVICHTPTATTPLVAWSVQNVTGPAFALDPILGPAAGQIGSTTEPSSGSALQRPVSPGSDGLTAAQISTVAYLLASHGGDMQPNVVGEVAATVASVRSPNPTAAACLAQHASGLDPATATGLWTTATRLAGPYTVTLRSGTRLLTLGQPAALTATVTAASGAPVPGMTVTFTAGAPAAGSATVQSITGADGAATAPLTVPMRSTAATVTATATVTAPVGLAAVESPGRVTVVTPAAPQTFTGHVTSPVDMTANPTVTPTLSRTLLLPGDDITAGLTVTGLHGHDGTATLAVLGPLPFRSHTGCATYTDRDWRTAPAGERTSVAGATAPVSGDGPYTRLPVTFAAAGCYTVTGTVTTSNAVPNVTRTTHYAAAGQTVTVAPITVTAAATGHGVAVAGRPAAIVTATGPTPVTVTHASGQLLGPLQPSYGTCPHTGWNTAPTVSAMTAAVNRPGSTVAISADTAVHAIGCYAYTLHATVHLPGLGDVAVASTPGQSGNTVLLIAATAQVVNLSDQGAATGGSVTTTVTVSGTLTLPGTLHIQLRHLPYNDQGCLDRDWTRATAAPAQGTDPSVTTHGDGDYVLTTPPLPGDGCWAPVPVLTLTGNRAITIVGAPPSHEMVAITGLGTSNAAIAAQRPVSDRYAAVRLILAILAFLIFLGVAVTATVVHACHDNARLNASPDAAGWFR
jgi:hypothetical protein